MPIPVSIILAACLLLAIPAHAEDTPFRLPAWGDVAYKGFVGKALDAVPLPPQERVMLQRTSAVVNGTLTGRSLGAWAGLSHPVLMIAGLAWGIYSAINIKPPRVAGANPDVQRAEPYQSLDIGLTADTVGPSQDEGAKGIQLW
ncbi:MAG: hypothetical protein KIT18_16670 [Burkholderiales bacterium]|nr:hypothetical protein [Burkholderiales bacterium]